MRLVMVDEAMMVADPEADKEDGGVAVGNAGSVELKAKTQENPHPTRRVNGRRRMWHRR